MTTVASPSATAGLALSPRGQTDREKLSATARQFEAIFVRQMLAAARKADFGGDSLFSDPGLETFRQMQDERFADIAAERGTLGIARMIEAQLARQAPARED